MVESAVLLASPTAAPLFVFGRELWDDPALDSVSPPPVADAPADLPLLAMGLDDRDEFALRRPLVRPFVLRLRRLDLPLDDPLPANFPSELCLGNPLNRASGMRLKACKYPGAAFISSTSSKPCP